jgi:hypothetical protein
VPAREINRKHSPNPC